jgi:phage terminase large subunit-like protein
MGKKAVFLYRELQADRIVAEKNNGGEMVEAVIKAVDRTVPVTLVHASRGKVVRAEPISALYEQGRVHHVGRLTFSKTRCVYSRKICLAMKALLTASMPSYGG